MVSSKRPWIWRRARSVVNIHGYAKPSANRMALKTWLRMSRKCYGQPLRQRDLLEFSVMWFLNWECTKINSKCHKGQGLDELKLSAKSLLHNKLDELIGYVMMILGDLMSMKDIVHLAAIRLGGWWCQWHNCVTVLRVSMIFWLAVIYFNYLIRKREARENTPDFSLF